MITWMTRISLLDSASDLELNQLAVAESQALALAYAFMGGDWDDAGVTDRHPLVMMWMGHEVALAAYAASCSVRLVQLGVTNGVQSLELAQHAQKFRKGMELDYEAPPWFSDTDVLRSHRSNLQRRWPDSYGEKWSGTPALMPYLWPFMQEDGSYNLMLSKHDKGLIASGDRVLPKKILDRIYNA